MPPRSAASSCVQPRDMRSEHSNSPNTRNERARAPPARFAARLPLPDPDMKCPPCNAILAQITPRFHMAIGAWRCFRTAAEGINRIDAKNERKNLAVTADSPPNSPTARHGGIELSAIVGGEQPVVKQGAAGTLFGRTGELFRAIMRLSGRGLGIHGTTAKLRQVTWRRGVSGKSGTTGRAAMELFCDEGRLTGGFGEAMPGGRFLNLAGS